MNPSLGGQVQHLKNGRNAGELNMTDRYTRLHEAGIGMNSSMIPVALKLEGAVSCHCKEFCSFKLSWGLRLDVASSTRTACVNHMSDSIPLREIPAT